MSRRDLHFVVGTMPAEAIKVAVRVRPFNGREKELKSELVISMEGPSQVCSLELLQGPTVSEFVGMFSRVRDL